jgi:hypothetical protein
MRVRQSDHSGRREALERRGSRGQTILSCFVCNIVIVTPSEYVPLLRGCLTAFTRALGGLSCGRLERKNPGVLYTDDLPERFCFRVSGWRAAVRLRGGWLACMDNNLSLYSAALPPRPQRFFGHEDRPRSIVLRSISA